MLESEFTHKYGLDPVALTNKRFVNDEAPFVYKKQTKSKIKACVTLETQAFMVKCIYEKQHLTVQLYT